MYKQNLLNNQLGFIDVLSIASFCIGLMNLDENITQGDMQELQQQVSAKTDLLLQEIHQHLQDQDNKIDKILNLLEDKNNDS